jgi:hypothetical protein
MYYVLCTETTVSYPPVAFLQSFCDVHLLRSPCLDFFLSAVQIENIEAVLLYKSLALFGHLFSETTVSNPPVVFLQSHCDVHLLRSPCLDCFLSAVQIENIEAVLLYKSLALFGHLFSETTVSNPPVVFLQTYCDVHLLRSPCLDSFLSAVQIKLLTKVWKPS